MKAIIGHGWRDRRRAVLQHRRVWFEKAFDSLIDGTDTVEHVHARALKLKAIGGLYGATR